MVPGPAALPPSARSLGRDLISLAVFTIVGEWPPVLWNERRITVIIAFAFRAILTFLASVWTRLVRIDSTVVSGIRNEIGEQVLFFTTFYHVCGLGLDLVDILLILSLGCSRKHFICPLLLN